MCTSTAYKHLHNRQFLIGEDTFCTRGKQQISFCLQLFRWEYSSPNPICQQLFWASTHLSDLSFKRGIFLDSTTCNMFLHLATSLLIIIPFHVWGEEGVKCSSGICLPAGYNRMDMPGGKPLRNSLGQILISYSILLLLPSLARYGSKGLKWLPKRSIVFFFEVVV